MTQPRSSFKPWLDYCNSLLAGSAKYQLEKLQRVQNMACRVVNNLRKYDHISASLMGLHWLKVKECIEYKIACLVFRFTENTAPNYLADLLPTKTSNRDLRSTNSTAIPLLKCKNTQTMHIHKWNQAWLIHTDRHSCLSTYIHSYILGYIHIHLYT